jgi:hypothetical protein
MRYYAGVVLDLGHNANAMFDVDRVTRREIARRGAVKLKAVMEDQWENGGIRSPQSPSEWWPEKTP